MLDSVATLFGFPRVFVADSPTTPVAPVFVIRPLPLSPVIVLRIDPAGHDIRVFATLGGATRAACRMVDSCVLDGQLSIDEAEEDYWVELDDGE